MGRCLLAPELQSELILLLQEDDKDARAEEGLRLECIVLEALLFLCHEGARTSVFVEEVTKTVNRILSGRSAGQKVLPRGVGAKLKSLGFYTERLGSRGRGIILTEAIRGRAHQMAMVYNLSSTQIGSDCPHCGTVPPAPTEMHM